jgi:anti-sigma B factor antagonist
MPKLLSARAVSRPSPTRDRLNHRPGIVAGGRGGAVGSPARPPRFACESVPERDRVRVAPAGELDLATVSQLERAVRDLWESGFTHLVLDLRGLCFLDLCGLRLILELDAAAHANSSTLELIAGGWQVQRVFDLTGTAERLAFRSAGGEHPHVARC